jgi:hypothetical protein
MSARLPIESSAEDLASEIRSLSTDELEELTRGPQPPGLRRLIREELTRRVR